MHPKKPRLENPEVLVIRTAGEAEKFALIAAEPEIFFTEPHFDGYAAVLVRLSAISVERLEALLRQAWERRTTPPTRTSRQRD